MLNNFYLLKTFSYLDEGDIEEAAESMGYCEKHPRTNHSNIWKTALIAAIIACLLAVSAVAVGLSIHARRQREINDSLQIDINQVENYKEYEVPEKTEPGLTVLSSKYDGECLTVYFDYSPVTEDELIDILNNPDTKDMGHYWGCVIDHAEYIRPALPNITNWDFAPEDCLEPTTDSLGNIFNKPKPEAMLRRLKEECYDVETETLTLKVIDVLYEPHESEIVLKAGKIINDGSFYLDESTVYTAVINPAEYNPAILNFPEPIEIIDEESGMDFTVLGAELSSTGCVLYIKSSGAEKAMDYSAIYEGTEDERQSAAEYQKKWLNALGRIESSTFLLLKDGTEIKLSGSNSKNYTDGIVKPYCIWQNQTVNVNEVEAIRINGNEVRLSECK